MKTKINIGQKFELTETGRKYEVTRVSEKSIWFKDLTRDPVWRRSINQFNEMIKNSFKLIN